MQLSRFWSRRSSSVARAGRLPCRPSLEGLEDRTLLTITLPTPGVPGPALLTGGPDADRFLIRLQPGMPSNIQFLDEKEAIFHTAALADVTAVTVNTLGGADTLTIDNQYGLVAAPGAGFPISFDGGSGYNELVLLGNPQVTVNQAYIVGLTADAGMILASAGFQSMNISFRHLSAITDALTAASLTMSANDNPNLIKLEDGLPFDNLPTMRIESIDFQGFELPLAGVPDNNLTNDATAPARLSFVPIRVANSSSVRVNALGGDDQFILDVTGRVPGLTSLVLDGGTGNDRLLIQKTPLGVSTNFVNIEVVVQEAQEQVFVQNLYNSLLKRTASDAEVQRWLTVLHGSGGQAAVVAGINRSLEARTLLVRQWYASYLGRQAMNGEEQGWVNRLLAGVPEEVVLSGILGSSEFAKRAGSLATGATSDEQFIRALYVVLLNRTASVAEVARWIPALPALDRGGVALAFLNSEEFRMNFATSLYQIVLRRNPDVVGLRSWASSGLGMSAMLEGFLGSLEFFQ
jgi:hypothetical protein